MFREQSGSAWKPKQDTNRGTESLKGVVLSKGGMKWSHHRLVACEPQRRIPNFVALCAADCYPVRVLGWAVWPDLHVSCTLGGSCEARIGRRVQQHVLCLCFYQVTTCVFLLCRLFCERSGRDAAKKKEQYGAVCESGSRCGRHCSMEQACSVSITMEVTGTQHSCGIFLLVLRLWLFYLEEGLLAQIRKGLKKKVY